MAEGMALLAGVEKIFNETISSYQHLRRKAVLWPSE